jgi:RNA polymerase sigma factor (sigma-70 family)
MGDEENPSDVRALLEAHHAPAWRWAVFCAGSIHRGEDLLHDVYVKVLNGKARFDGRSSFRTWLFVVIRWSAVAARRRDALLSILMEPIREGISDIAASPSLLHEPLSPELASALAELPQKQRQVAMLVFEHDLTLEQAARVMNVKVGSARQHYSRAKQKLRAALTKGTRDE